MTNQEISRYASLLMIATLPMAVATAYAVRQMDVSPFAVPYTVNGAKVANLAVRL